MLIHEDGKRNDMIKYSIGFFANAENVIIFAIKN